MQNDEKNKSKGLGLMGKQLGFFALVLLWIVAILFKSQLGAAKWYVYGGLIVLTLVSLYFINKSFFGIGDKNGN